MMADEETAREYVENAERAKPQPVRIGDTGELSEFEFPWSADEELIGGGSAMIRPAVGRSWIARTIWAFFVVLISMAAFFARMMLAEWVGTKNDVLPLKRHFV